MIKTLATAALAAALLAMGARPADACLSCGCGGSGTSADLGALGAAAAIFSLGSHWLVQESLSFRSITGSFNETGRWSPMPVDGTLHTAQATVGVSYIPMPGLSIGLQLPLVANGLDKATWGPLGSVNPTDLPRDTGAALGDVAVQGSVRLWEHDQLAVAGWAGATAPSGVVLVPAQLSGGGVWAGSGGLLAIAQPGDWELVANLGYQRPFGRPPLTTATYYLGEAWLYQASASYKVAANWRLGAAASGFRGQGRFGTSDLPVPLAKLKVMPTLQYEWSPTQGVRLALGVDPAGTGTNNMSDLTAYAVFYRFVP